MPKSSHTISSINHLLLFAPVGPVAQTHVLDMSANTV